MDCSVGTFGATICVMATVNTSSSPRHQVVVIGSGFGGLFGTKALRRADVDVTMIATRQSLNLLVTIVLPEPVPITARS